MVAARLPSKIPSTWLSEKFLANCLERKKGGEAAGYVATFRNKWGREGMQEVERYMHQYNQTCFDTSFTIRVSEVIKCAGGIPQSLSLRS